MKLNFSKHIAIAGLVLLGAAGLTGCQDSFDDPTAEIPVATLKPNMTIAEFKAEFWQADVTNYCVEIPAREDGSHYIISGRVISSDYYGNIFKCLYIQDETAALPMSINQYNLYTTNRVGQEIVVDLTGMYCGMYNGMFQLGFPEWYENGQAWETSFMAPELFRKHIEYNGNPRPELVDTILINDFSELASDIANLQKLQGQIVRFNNATFVNAGVNGKDQLCMTYHSSGENQSLNVCDNSGAINVRTSGYAKFWNTKLPTEPCDVVGILSFYGTQGWQLLLNDIDGLMNVGNATTIGTHEKPYSVGEAIALSESGSTNAWVKGYIVGSVAPEVTEVTSNDDITWEAPFILDNTLVIAAEPTVRDFTQCILVPLNDGSNLFTIGNLVDNPDNLGKWLNLQGRFTRSMGMAAVTGNQGNPGSFELEGVPYEDPTVKDGDGSEAAPYSPSQVIALNNPGTTAWVKGYIVGVLNSNNNYAFETVPTTVASSILIADSPDETDKNKCVPVQLPVGDIRTALNLVNNPGNLGKQVAVKGSLEKYFLMPGVKNTSEYKLDDTTGGDSGNDNPGGNDTPTGGTKESPYTVEEANAIGATGAEAWVEGYIVGYSTNGTFSAKFTAEGAVAANVLIASSATETDPAKVFPIQLSSNTDIRAALNLKDHPENLGKKVKILGKLESYFSNRTGLKSTTEYEFE